MVRSEKHNVQFLYLHCLVALLGLTLLSVAITGDNARAEANYESIVLSPDTKEVNIAPYLWWSQDKEASILLEDIVYQRVALTWRKGTSENPNFGLNTPPYWFRLNVTNPTTREFERWLEIQYPVLDTVEVYLLTDGYVLASYRTGDALPFSHRPVANRHFVFPLKFGPQQSYEIFIRVKTEGSMQLPAVLWEPQLFLDEDQWLLAAQLLFTGIMLAMAGYNLILWILIRDSIYGLYVAYVVSIAIVQLSLHGTSYQFFWPDSPGWNQHQLIFFIGTSMIFASLFSYRYLDLHTQHKGLGYLILSGVVLGVASSIMALSAPYVMALKLAMFTVFLLSIILLGSGAFLWWLGTSNAPIFTIGWGIFLIGNISIVLTKIAVLPNLHIIEYGPQIGSTAEVFLFSLALAQRINQERKQRLLMQERALQLEREAREAQQETLEVQQQTNEELERRVALRTEELKTALSTLSRVNSQLRELAVRNELTQLYSMDQFRLHLQEEWSRCARSVSSLSLVLIKVDNFEQVNKNYGQVAIKSYLKELGKKLEDLTERAGDRAYRLSEDEFALLLPHSAIENALQVAEHVRSYSEAKLMVVEGHRFTVTLSIGISNEIPDISDSMEGIIRRARSAIETARNQGGNAVQFSLDS
ncbi:sensor domain-containing diguanylate cyclase [Hahella ganghwensis]|uniref:sensor domain-containing diguanylate cyclase n=1 Tax=Hahella ganghwensis TaxID=286420 RepID=UPI0003660BE0|nr:7TM diverse intracellular signaling domain-containing protein [Hahella ganghwensis]